MGRRFHIAIPLPRYSNRAYDITHDYHGAGWLWCGFSVGTNRIWRGISIDFQWGVWWRLNKRWEDHQPEIRRG